MPRPVALVLVSFGFVLGAAGLVLFIAGIQRLPGGVDLLVAGMILGGFGAAMLIGGLAGYRRAAARPPAADGGPGDYAPNQTVTRELDGAPYSVHYTPPVHGKNSRPSCLRVSTPVEARGEFHMAPETWFDQVCKRFGLAVEIETGDALFDAECYVRSDTPEFAAEYLADPVKRVAIRDLRRLGFAGVTLEGGTLTAAWTGFNPKVNDRPELCADAAARVVLLARNLPPHMPEFERRTGTHRKQWQAVLWLFLAGFAATLLSLIAYTPLDGLGVMLRALIILVPGLPVFAYLAAGLLRGTSTSHTAWGGLMIGALFLFPAGSCGTVTLLNGALDPSPPVVREAVIVEKYTTRSKNRTNYHVRVASWRNPGRTESFEVSSADHQAVVPHQSRMAVTTRAGLLGVEWMAAKRVVANPAGP
jgi:hypothetical protein